MSAVIGKQVLVFGKSEKSEFINIGIFAASSGGRKGRRHIGRFTPDQERSHVWVLTFGGVSRSSVSWFKPSISPMYISYALSDTQRTRCL